MPPKLNLQLMIIQRIRLSLSNDRPHPCPLLRGEGETFPASFLPPLIGPIGHAQLNSRQLDRNNQWPKPAENIADKNPLLGERILVRADFSADGPAVPKQFRTACPHQTRHSFQPKCLKPVRGQRNFIGRPQTDFSHGSARMNPNLKWRMGLLNL